MQSKLESFVEAIASTLIGLVIAFTVTQWFLGVIDVKITPAQNAVYTAFMTLVSVLRSYTVRRLFNSRFWRRKFKAA